MGGKWGGGTNTPTTDFPGTPWAHPYQICHCYYFTNLPLLHYYFNQLLVKIKIQVWLLKFLICESFHNSKAIISLNMKRKLENYNSKINMTTSKCFDNDATASTNNILLWFSKIHWFRSLLKVGYWQNLIQFTISSVCSPFAFLKVKTESKMLSRLCLEWLCSWINIFAKNRYCIRIKWKH